MNNLLLGFCWANNGQIIYASWNSAPGNVSQLFLLQIMCFKLFNGCENLVRELRELHAWALRSVMSIHDSTVVYVANYI